MKKILHIFQQSQNPFWEWKVEFLLNAVDYR